MHRDPAGTHMSLHVGHLGDGDAGSLFLLAYYFESLEGWGRSLVPDPEVLLLRTRSGGWVPLSVRTPWVSVVTAEISDGGVRVVLAGEHARLVRLVEAWISNVARAGLVPTERVVAGPNQAVA